MPGYERYSLTTLEMIESSAKRIITQFNDRTTIAFPAHPVPFGAYSCFQAAILQSRLAQETGHFNNFESVNVLKSALKHLDTRWKVAGMIVHIE